MDPYHIEPRGERCPTCQHGEQYEIIGPDGSTQSQSWGDLEEAEDICEMLNAAHAAGHEAAGRIVLDALNALEINVLSTATALMRSKLEKGKETSNAEAPPQEPAPTPTPWLPSEADEDIPF